VRPTHALHESQSYAIPSTLIPTSISLANPLSDVSASRHGVTPPPANRTLGAREVYGEASAALKEVLVGVETADQLQDLLREMQEIR
jgi:hypothetical protein